MNQVASDLGQKHLLPKLRRIRIASINRDTASRRHKSLRILFATRHARITLIRQSSRIDDSPRFRRTAAEHRNLVARYGHIVHRTADIQSRVAYDGLLRQHNVLNRIANIADEAITQVIECIAKASSPGKQFEAGICRIKTKIIARNRNRRHGLIDAVDDFSAVRAACSVDLMVKPPNQVIGDSLNVELTKTGENLCANVGLPVAIFILQIPDIRSCRDKDSAAINGDARGPRKIASKDLALIEDTVVVGIFEQSNLADGQVTGAFDVGLVSRFVGVRVIVHFDDVEPSVFIECSRHRISHQRFGGDQLHREAVF